MLALRGVFSGSPEERPEAVSELVTVHMVLPAVVGPSMCVRVCVDVLRGSGRGGRFTGCHILATVRSIMLLQKSYFM